VAGLIAAESTEKSEMVYVAPLSSLTCVVALENGRTRAKSQYGRRWTDLTGRSFVKRSIAVGNETTRETRCRQVSIRVTHLLSDS